MTVKDRPTTQATALSEWRCPVCGKLLAKVSISPPTTLWIKCERCGAQVVKQSG